MRVTVYSLDETDLEYASAEELGGVIPIKRATQLETFKILWEGEMSAIPTEGDVLMLMSPSGESFQVHVLLRIFHLDTDEPLLAVFVSQEDDGEASERC